MHFLLFEQYQEESIKSELEDFRSILIGEYPIDDLMLTIHDDGYDGYILEIGSIRIKEESKSQGLGTEVLNKIIKWANEHNVILALTPISNFGKRYENRLIKWYKGLGFKMNKGRNKHYGTRRLMIKYPN